MSHARRPLGDSRDSRTWVDFGVYLLFGVLLLLLATLGGHVIIRSFSTRGPTVSLAERLPLGPGNERHPMQIRLGVNTQYSPRVAFLRHRGLVETLGQELQQDMSICIRPTHTGLRRDLETGVVDIAILATGSAARMSEDATVLVAVPVLPEGLECRSAVIVSADSTRLGLADLAGGRFAFSDPESTTGHDAARRMLAAAGLSDAAAFRQVVFTGAQDRSVQLVANGYVDGAAVSTLVLDGLSLSHPQLVERVRVIALSDPLPPPPVVAASGLSPTLRDQVRQVLCRLHEDGAGQQMLAELRIARFEPGDAAAYRDLVDSADWLSRSDVPRVEAP